MVYANELIFGAFTLKQCSSRLVIEILKMRSRLWPWLWLRLRCWQWLWVKIIMSRAIKREPKSPICVVGIGIKSWLNCLEKLSFFGCWKSLSAASKCRKTHPCDYRISKFPGVTCPWTLPILCPGVKLSCPPVQNLNEPSGRGIVDDAKVAHGYLRLGWYFISLIKLFFYNLNPFFIKYFFTLEKSVSFERKL